jgi:transcriptional regulator with XRE-family HTH domain
MDGGVGAKLRDARLQRGLNLAEVEEATKIQARFLAAIENEEWSALPGEFYARSFIRSYAGYLGLDEPEAPSGLAAAGAERLPRIDPQPPQPAQGGHRRRPSSRLLAALATLGLAAVLLAIGLSGPGDDSSGPSPARQPSGAEAKDIPSQGPRQSGASLTLTATAEVWVCLLDGRGQALINGQILSPGSEQGPYRSDSFTLALGNGAVTMSLGGQKASIPPTPNPIGFAIDDDGTMRELPEGERPTCT